jgi:hypothetical protein
MREGWGKGRRERGENEGGRKGKVKEKCWESVNGE